MKRIIFFFIGAVMLCGCSASKNPARKSGEEPAKDYSEVDVSLSETGIKDEEYSYTVEQVEPLKDRILTEAEFDDITLYDIDSLVDRVVVGTVSDIKEWVVHEVKNEYGTKVDYYATTFILHVEDTGEEISIMLPYSTRLYCYEWVLPEEGQTYHAALKERPSDKMQRGNPTEWLAEYYVPFANLLFSADKDEVRLSEMYKILGQNN